MKIILNNRDTTIDKDKISVTELLQQMNFTFKIITVKVNGTFIKKDDYDKTFIVDGDVVAAIHLITGG